METKSEFSYVLKSNEHAKNIAGHAFIIKLNALNALLLALRVDESMRGYIVVTDEFIRFSKEVIELAEKLRVKINRQVLDISRQLIYENKYRLMNKAIAKSAKALFLDSVTQFIDENAVRMRRFVSDMYNHGNEVIAILNQSEKFILRGDILAMQAKIEGAYSEKSQEVFRDVAESLNSSIQDIKKTINGMEYIMSSNIRQFQDQMDKLNG